jgi:hypothetical protein
MRTLECLSRLTRRILKKKPTKFGRSIRRKRPSIILSTFKVEFMML